MKYNPRFVAAFFASQKIPPFVRELQFHSERKWRFDFAWIEYRVGLEVQGGLFIAGRHSRGAGIAKDMEKFSEAAALGWRILYCQPQDLCTMDMVKLIHRTLKYEKTSC
jgi:hypothetical protein